MPLTQSEHELVISACEALLTKSDLTATTTGWSWGSDIKDVAEYTVWEEDRQGPVECHRVYIGVSCLPHTVLS